jgi:hypothetical protein
MSESPALALAPEMRSSPLVLALMAVVAFAIWSLAIPDSGWYDWNSVASNPGWVALIAGVGGLVFGAIADTFLGD